MLEVWHIPSSFRIVQCFLFASTQTTEYKAPSKLCHSRQAAEFLLMEVNFKISQSPLVWIKPRTSSAAGQDSITRPLGGQVPSKRKSYWFAHNTIANKLR